MISCQTGWCTSNTVGWRFMIKRNIWHKLYREVHPVTQWIVFKNINAHTHLPKLCAVKLNLIRTLATWSQLVTNGICPCPDSALPSFFFRSVTQKTPPVFIQCSLDQQQDQNFFYPSSTNDLWNLKETEEEKGTQRDRKLTTWSRTQYAGMLVPCQTALRCLQLRTLHKDRLCAGMHHQKQLDIKLTY